MLEDLYGITYGSYNAPVNLGSGGWNTAGGGAVILNITNALNVAGSILANGGAGGETGSGGSIYITAGSLTGAGSLSASAGSGVEGGGGRIAVIASTSGYSGTIQAYGAASTNTGAAGTIFIQTPSTNGTLIIDNNSVASIGYAQIPSANYSGTVFDQIWLKHNGRLQMNYPSTFTINSVSNVIGDGTGELRPDGLLTTPASLSISSYTLSISSFSSVPSLTYLDVGNAAIFNLGGSTQTPVVNLSSITIENGGILTHWANSTTGAGEIHKLNLTLSSVTINAGGKIDVTSKDTL